MKVYSRTLTAFFFSTTGCINTQEKPSNQQVNLLRVASASKSSAELQLKWLHTSFNSVQLSSNGAQSKFILSVNAF